MRWARQERFWMRERRERGGVANLAILKKPLETGKAAGAEAISNAKQGIADIVRTPENKPTPTTRGVARAGGLLAGHAMSVPGGEIAGVLSGPSLADAALPKRRDLQPGLGHYSPFDEAEQQSQLSKRFGETEKVRTKELTDQGRLRQIEEREGAKQTKAATTANKPAPFTGGVAQVPEPRPRSPRPELRSNCSTGRRCLEGVASPSRWRQHPFRNRDNLDHIQRYREYLANGTE
jgi:hypothetical protein